MSFVHDLRHKYNYRPSYPYNAGTDHVGFSPTRQGVLNFTNVHFF